MVNSSIGEPLRHLKSLSLQKESQKQLFNSVKINFIMKTLKLHHLANRVDLG